MAVLNYFLIGSTEGLKNTISRICATTITIEVDIAPGIKFFLVGLPDNAEAIQYRSLEREGWAG